jgi:hypothetical protein
MGLDGRDEFRTTVADSYYHQWLLSLNLLADRQRAPEQETSGFVITRSLTVPTQAWSNQNLKFLSTLVFSMKMIFFEQGW